MTLPEALARFALVAALLTITPGLDTVLVLRSALVDGARAAFATASGVASGCLLWGLAAALGISALVTASATAYQALKLAGAVYLGFLGVRMLLSALRGGSHLTLVVDAAAHPAGRPRSSFLRGLTTNLLNPKIGVFYVAILPQFLPVGVQPALAGTLLALVHGVEGLVWFAAIIALADRARVWLTNRRAQRLIDGLAGAALLGFGIALLTPQHA